MRELIIHAADDWREVFLDGQRIFANHSLRDNDWISILEQLDGERVEIVRLYSEPDWDGDELEEFEAFNLALGRGEKPELPDFTEVEKGAYP